MTSWNPHQLEPWLINLLSTNSTIVNPWFSPMINPPFLRYPPLNYIETTIWRLSAPTIVLVGEAVDATPVCRTWRPFSEKWPKGQHDTRCKTSWDLQVFLLCWNGFQTLQAFSRYFKIFQDAEVGRFPRTQWKVSHGPAITWPSASFDHDSQAAQRHHATHLNGRRRLEDVGKSQDRSHGHWHFSMMHWQFRRYPKVS